KGEKQLSHHLSPLSEATAVDASHHLVPGASFGDVLVALSGEIHDPGDLVPRRPIVTGDLGLDDDGRADLVGNAEVRCLPKSPDSLGALGLPRGNPGGTQPRLNRVLHYFTNELGYCISVGGKGTPQIALVEQHRVGHILVCRVSHRGEAVTGVKLIQAM